MKPRNQVPGVYEVPTYEAPTGAAWFHFMHGNVPGHQIDFIYRPRIPEGPLSRQHFGHLSRILQYIEPRDRDEQAFAIGNLSRDDTQHEPGHGGIALVFGLRVHGARDHAGREEPSFSHAIVAVDRDLDEEALVSAALVFRQRLVESTRPTEDGVGFYHAYTSCGEDRLRAGALLRAYVSDFDDLPVPLPSRSSLRWTAEGVVQPKRIVLVHDDGASFEDLARCAARIAAVLYTSDVRWTVISNGREADLPNGTTIRLVPASVGVLAEDGVVVRRLEDVPEGAEALAAFLFQAKPVTSLGGAGKRKKWREEAARDEAIEVAFDEEPEVKAPEVTKKPSKRGSRRWLGPLGALVLGVAALCVVWFSRKDALPIEPTVSAAEPTPAPVATAEAPREEQTPPRVEATTKKEPPRPEATTRRGKAKPGKAPQGREKCKAGSDLDDCPM